MEKKEITSRTTVKAIITGFISYGIIINFICLLIFTIGNYFLKNLQGTNINGLYITLPLIADFIIFFLAHLICNISTFDVFKKCKTNPDNYKKIIRNLDIFFVLCIILSICLFLGLLYLNLQYQTKSIEYTVLQYKEIFSEEHTLQLQNEMTDLYNTSKTNLIKSTVILEIGFAISFLSLIPYQRKMITRYNEF
jgi:hypothetical protein